MTRSSLLYGAALFAALGLAPAALAAGPCTSQIAQLGKQLGGQTGLGAPVSEPSAGLHAGQGSAQQASPSPAAGSSSSASGDTQKLGQSAGAAGGVAGAVGAAAGTETAQGIASGRIATSPEDVRRQSEGKPTTAQASMNPNASAATNADKVSQAKAALQRAVDLNAKGDKSCMKAIRDARNLMPKH